MLRRIQNFPQNLKNPPNNFPQKIVILFKGMWRIRFFIIGSNL